MPLAEWKERTRLLVGEEQIERLAQAHILVVGLGGVGGAAAEMMPTVYTPRTSTDKSLHFTRT